MEVIKLEPCQISDEYANIEIKQESEIEIGEIDDAIFLQGCPDSSETLIDSNVYHPIESVIIHDQIIKEEPVFYDAMEKQVLLFQDKEKSKSSEQFEPIINTDNNDAKIYECYICGCRRVNYGLLKWHYLERHVKKTSGRGIKKWIYLNGSNRNGNRPVFKCSYCLRNFKTKERVEKHERIHKNTQPFKCPTCFKSYNDKNNFEAHVRVHTGERPFGCEICGTKFRSRSHLYHHRKAHEIGKFLPEPKPQLPKIIENVEAKDFAEFRIFECYLCRFHGPINRLQVHMRDKHTGKRLIQCEVCSKKFVRNCLLKQHMRVHAKRDYCQCNICGRRVTSKKALETHLITHTGEFAHECKYCHKKYSTDKILRTHIRTHTGLRPHVCDYCKKGFVRRGDMIRHTRIHTGERPYKCDICESAFARNHLLIDHKRSIHKIIKVL